MIMGPFIRVPCPISHRWLMRDPRGNRRFNCHRAHFDLMPILVALILIAHAAYVSNVNNQAAAMVYFFGMLVLYAVLTLGIPYPCKIVFLIGGFGA